jgi:salicylate hydroxylase
MEQAVTLLGEEKAKNCQAYLGYHGHMLTFPVAAGRFMNVVAFQSSKTWTHDKMVIGATKEEMMRDFGPWGEDVKNIVKLMGQSDIWALFDHPPAETYYKGRICLLGDAAHASTPFQGAGAGMAVEDAYVLGRILQAVQRADQLPLAFAAYDGVRRERTQKVVTSSRESGYIWHFEALGDDVDKIKGGLKDRLRWIWDKHLDEDVDSALKVLQSGR